MFFYREKSAVKPPLIVIAGPTACGKTAVSVELAQRIGGEIISADSMQVYKYMDIGTAKPTADEMKGVRHYLIDELYPDEDYSVAVFASLAKKYAGEIYAKGKIPILAGGTGFYINAFVKGTEFSETAGDTAWRHEMYALAEEKGNAFLHDMLVQTDPEAAAAIHANNVKRVVRALEYHRLTGERISAHNERETERESAYGALTIVLSRRRERLYAGIESRVDDMVKRGLADEVKRLLDMGYGEELTPMMGLGYRQMIPAVRGETTVSEAASLLKRDTRRFAKRQITWFKNRCGGLWVDVDEYGEQCIIVDKIVEKLKEGGWINGQEFTGFHTE